jgi:hypothetical protein
MKYKMATYELYALAVAAFIVDHIGVTLFPGVIWFRIFRLFALVWFFPVGYLSAWRSPPRVWFGLGLMTFASFFLPGHVLPLCALATILAVRPVIDPLMEYATKSAQNFWGVQGAVLLLLFPLKELMEYGGVAIMFATAGWLTRHREQISKDIVDLRQYMVFMTAVYLAYAQLVFNFPPAPAVFVVVSTAACAWQLLSFKDMIAEDLCRQHSAPGGFEKFCRFLAHNSLEIYVGSFLFLKVLSYELLSHAADLHAHVESHAR